MEIRVPEVGESVYEALLAKWFKKNGDYVKKDEPVCELETDKITIDLGAEAAGVLTILVAEGTTVRIGTVIGQITKQAAEVPSGPAASVQREAEIRSAVSSPAARYEMREGDIDPESVSGTGKGGRISLNDLFARIEQTSRRPSEPQTPAEAQEVTPVVTVTALSSVETEQVAEKTPARKMDTPVEPILSVHSEETPVYKTEREDRRPMSPLRKRITERLLAARQQTAMLTTFNEADLGHVKALREKYKEHFRQRHGVSLGLMPFFVRACVEALKEFPVVNAAIDGDDIVYHHYYDIGIAIGGEKGLVVPVLRNADRLRLYEIDLAIAGFAEKIKTNKLAISDLTGGTFTISNGGVYGSMLSTPIVNPPQSAVLGMHAIQDRPVVRDGQVVIRPMMYLALSYDHRLIDGREAVGFLGKVKDYIEEPEELLLEG